MERLTEYSCGVAVIRNKNLINKAMYDLARYEDTGCTCGYEFSRDLGDGYHDIPIERKTKYCPDCGQKLQWDDKE
jgi:hypothetical protein